VRGAAVTALVVVLFIALPSGHGNGKQVVAASDTLPTFAATSTPVADSNASGLAKSSGVGLPVQVRHLRWLAAVTLIVRRRALTPYRQP
jgi:hypothetical protein